MNKSILCLTFILISFVGLAQEKVYWKSLVQDSTKDCKWANQINRLVSPRYVLVNGDSHTFYKEISLDKKKLVISVVADTIDWKEYDIGTNNKIFVFLVKNNRLIILDSSSEFKTDGRGPQISVHSDSLVITHTFHHGYDELTYRWDNVTNKYLLSNIWISSGEIWSRRKVINKKLHFAISLKLKDMKDPSDYEE